MANSTFKVKFYVLHAQGKKSDYFSLIADLGYAKRYVSFDRALCAEILGISVYDLFTIPLGDSRPVPCHG